VCCHRGRAQVPISWLAPRTPARHILEDALPLLFNSLPILPHLPLQTYLDFNGIYVGLGTVACIGCWVFLIFGAFLDYVVLYLFYRRWCFRECARLNVLNNNKTYHSPSSRPLILPILHVVAGLSVARVCVCCPNKGGERGAMGDRKSRVRGEREQEVGRDDVTEVPPDDRG
jgi:hypothetical protein